VRTLGFDAHGAEVFSIVGADAFAQGACVDSLLLFPVARCGVEVDRKGWFAVWAVLTGTFASGSRSKLKREPNGKCCTTGNLPSTSASYIFNMPLTDQPPQGKRHPHHTLLILPQPALTPEISYSVGECSQNGPVLTS
jgi:hypothetical protein